MVRRSEILTAASAIVAWYAIVLAAASPLANGPVVDSWLYAHSTRDFIAGGRIRFAGYSQVMPFAQILYGASWARLFGAGDRSLALSVAFLGASGAIFFYLLMRRSGADHENSMLATAILAFNPCYLFLSFSFMTEIPFLTALLASLLAATRAIQTRSTAMHWLAAGLIVIAFLVRPFALAAIPGCALALVFDTMRRQTAPARAIRVLLPQLAPYLLSFGLCVLASLIVARLEPTPFLLARHFRDLRSAFGRSLFTVYLRGGILEPVLYLGLVLAPLAVPLGLGIRPKRGLALGIILFTIGAALILAPGDFFGLP
ncbi:MAG TPA: glycosyltransferase family 39 protein, partial [Candidatus Binataceae bacterium]